MKLTHTQYRFLRLCANRAQRSTANVQNTVRALLRRGLLMRLNDGYVGLTLQGSQALIAELERPGVARAS